VPGWQLRAAASANTCRARGPPEREYRHLLAAVRSGCDGSPLSIPPPYKKKLCHRDYEDRYDKQGFFAIAEQGSRVPSVAKRPGNTGLQEFADCTD